MLSAHEEARKMLPRSAMLIGGEWSFESSDGKTLEHNDPSTGRPLGTMPYATTEDVDAAVKGARAAFPSWRALAVDKRRGILLAIARTMREHEKELLTIMALECGSPVGRGVVGRIADQFEYYAGWTDKFAGELASTYPRRALNYVKYEPLGVIVALVANNGPMINSAMKLGPALATGNVVIIRAPETGPFGIPRMVELMIEAGLPAGVVSVVTGGPQTAEALTKHPGIDKISLTGGLATARKVMQAAAENLKPVVLELGGKSANIIFEDADIDDVGTRGTLLSVLATNGQICIAPTRLLVHEGIYDRTLEQLVALSKLAVLGDPLDPRTTVGPVSNQASIQRIMSHIDEARSHARLLLGGARADGELAEGYFVEPTVFADVDNKSRLAQSEIFGPVLAVIPFKDERHAIEMANDTEFGLHAYLHTRDLKRAHRVADELTAGGVSINSMPVLTPSTPFGGVKSSGFGHEGGRASVEEFIHHKNIYVPLD